MANRHGPLMAHKQNPDDNEYATPPQIWRPLGRAVDGLTTAPNRGTDVIESRTWSGLLILYVL